MVIINLDCFAYATGLYLMTIRRKRKANGESTLLTHFQSMPNGQVSGLPFLIIRSLLSPSTSTILLS